MGSGSIAGDSRDVKAGQLSPEVLREIVAAVGSLRFGTVEITIHDARVTQIERREKIRFDRGTSGRA